MLNHLLRYSMAVAMLLSAGVPARAQVPDFYKTMQGAVWVVKDASLPIDAWQKVGLEDLRDHGKIAVHGSSEIGARFVTGRLGGFDIEILEPQAGDPVFDSFLERHGDGVFALLFAAPDPQQLASERARLGALGVRVLGRLDADGAQYTFFDTEREGKYVLALVSRSQPGAVATAPEVTHVGLVIRKAEPVSEFWKRLGFPAMSLADASPREDGRYHGKPLLLPFVVGWQNYSHPTFEWIIPPENPPNCYSDFLRAHGEGVQHLGVPVANLETALERYAKLGWSPVQTGAWGEVGKPGSGRYAYMDTDALGVSLELIQAIR